jgi:TfoX/Sxy family transcriptional regulator of competence genes
MASDQEFVEFVVEHIKNVGAVSWRKMFGEYAVYIEGKVVALICDNQVFVKQTAAGKMYIGKVVEAPAYPGAKPSYLIDNFEDAEWFSGLLRVTARELPMPKPKKKRA